MSDDSFEYEFPFRPQIRALSSQGDSYRSGQNRPAFLGQLGRAAKCSSLESLGGARASYDVGQTPRNSRRCVVKSHYVPMARGGRLAAGRHLAYLEPDGFERDGSPGQLYGPDVALDREAFAEPLKGETRQFRFIVSPEDAQQIDLTVFARELVSQMEKDFGRPLVWAALNHHNTEHPHVRIVVRGVDGDGLEVRIPPRYIQHDMRARAQQLLTRELGLCTDIDIARQQSHEVDQERLTSTDRGLAELLTPEGHLDARAVAQLRADLVANADGAFRCAAERRILRMAAARRCRDDIPSRARAVNAPRNGATQPPPLAAPKHLLLARTHSPAPGARGARATAPATTKRPTEERSRWVSGASGEGELTVMRGLSFAALAAFTVSACASSGMLHSGPTALHSEKTTVVARSTERRAGGFARVWRAPRLKTFGLIGCDQDRSVAATPAPSASSG